LAAAVRADKDDAGCRATRWRFDELHVGIPYNRRAEFAHACNIFPAGYEFEAVKAPIS
jgi:hypothetical protein